MHFEFAARTIVEIQLTLSRCEIPARIEMDGRNNSLLTVRAHCEK